MDKMRNAKFKIGQVVKHRLYPFRGVIFDIDPVFNKPRNGGNQSPPKTAPAKISRSIICLPRMRRPNTSPMCPSRICCPIRRARRSATRM